MMGSGKSAVGAELAKRWSCSFHDLDEQIEDAAGQSITEIFRKSGEAGFRELERQAVQDIRADFSALDPSTSFVIATGGGSLLDIRNRVDLESIGVLIHLSAAPDALAQRVANQGSHRPLLQSMQASTTHKPEESSPQEQTPIKVQDIASRTRRLETILDHRYPIYGSIALDIATEGLDIADVADEIERLIEALDPGIPRKPQSEIQSIPVRTPSDAALGLDRPGYSVLIGGGLLDAAGPLMRARGLRSPVMLVSDERVAAHYVDRLRQSLESARIPVRATALMGQGENAKSPASVAELCEQFVAAGLDRTCSIVALGGGIVGDTAGFAAASALRGVGFVQIPSSLLAMVDASVGGKVGVNLGAGKNLMGAFKHPRLVLVDPSLLATLDPRHLRAGMAEVLKAALIAGESAFAHLEEGGMPALADIAAWNQTIRQAVALKAEIVTEDPHEAGRRVVLNLGHTFAHAIERVSRYRYLHGEAVGIGLLAAARLSSSNPSSQEVQEANGSNLSEEALPERIEDLLQRIGLPCSCPDLDPEALADAMQVDKKRMAGRLRFLLLPAPGEVYASSEVGPEELSSALESICRPK